MILIQLAREKMMATSSSNRKAVCAGDGPLRSRGGRYRQDKAHKEGKEKKGVIKEKVR